MRALLGSLALSEDTNFDAIHAEEGGGACIPEAKHIASGRGWGPADPGIGSADGPARVEAPWAAGQGTRARPTPRGLAGGELAQMTEGRAERGSERADGDDPHELLAIGDGKAHGRSRGCLGRAATVTGAPHLFEQLRTAIEASLQLTIEPGHHTHTTPTRAEAGAYLSQEGELLVSRDLV